MKGFCGTSLLPVPLTHINITFGFREEEGMIAIETTVRTTYKTYAEVEALTAATIAVLTIYCMCKAVDNTITIEQAYIAQKSGGKSGLVTFQPEKPASH
ncbi:cyclic pyranopterin monophosphate synthase MoaC [Ktedonosporobacter rubrisoli]|nr:cyclic pyranopterin monophosphate synthase MoaC [Ktedonosporobacter rubrisoli]